MNSGAIIQSAVQDSPDPSQVKPESTIKFHETKTKTLIETLRKRALLAKLYALVALLFIIFGIFASIFTINSAGRIVGNDLAEAEISKREAIREYMEQQRPMQELPVTDLNALNDLFETTNPTTILQINITRFGIVAIILFAITILLGIYRMERRLSVAYFTRADALGFLCDHELPTDVVIPFILTSPNVDFGRTPKHPMENVGEITRTISEK